MRLRSDDLNRTEAQIAVDRLLGRMRREARAEAHMLRRARIQGFADGLFFVGVCVCVALTFALLVTASR